MDALAQRHLGEKTISYDEVTGTGAKRIGFEQVDVARDVAAQMKAGGRCVFGVMVESHLNEGSQKFSPGKDDPAKLTYGQSITDACIGWDDSIGLLDTLAGAVRARRGKGRGKR